MTLVRRIALIAVGAATMALVLTLVSNPHSMSLRGCHVPAKRWPALSLVQQRKYVVCNLAHARGAIRWARHHRYPAAAGVIRAHRRIVAKATANLERIEALLHPPFSYPWWWVPLGICETGVNPPDPAYGKPGHPGGDGYEGWINFLPSTWLTYGGGQFAAHAYDASEYEQYLVTLAMHRDVPWSQSNPACSTRLGLS